MPDLVRAVLERCDPDLLPRALGATRGLEWVALRGRGRGRKSNIAVLSGGSPVLFLKVSGPSGLADLTIEHEALVQLQQHPELHGSVPAPLGVHEVAGRHLLVQTALPGTPLSIVLRTTTRRRATVSGSLVAVQQWLQGFHHATADGRWAPDSGELIDQFREHAERTGAVSPAAGSTLHRLERSAAAHPGLTLPATSGHGDFWPGNLLRAGGRVGVVDWEHYEPSTMPLRDLWFVLMTTAYSFPWQGRRWVEPGTAFELAFLRKGWYGDLVLSLVRKHMRALDVPVTAGELLLFQAAAHNVLWEEDAGAPVGPTGADWSAITRALLEAGGSRLREL